MTKRFLVYLLLSMMLLSMILPAQAQTVRYVSDALQAPLRSGAAGRFKIARMVPSGTELKVLQPNATGGYFQVQTPDGARGWIAGEHLMDTPSARAALAGAQQTLATLQRENADLRQQLNLASGGSGEIASQLMQNNEENQRLRQELARLRKLADTDIKLDERNRRLEEQVIHLERELQIARQEAQALIDSRDNTMFLLGAGILLLGLLLGVTLAGGRARRREHWREL